MTLLTQFEPGRRRQSSSASLVYTMSIDSNVYGLKRIYRAGWAAKLDILFERKIPARKFKTSSIDQFEAEKTNQG